MKAARSNALAAFFVRAALHPVSGIGTLQGGSPGLWNENEAPDQTAIQGPQH